MKAEQIDYHNDNNGANGALSEQIAQFQIAIWFPCIHSFNIIFGCMAEKCMTFAEMTLLYSKMYSVMPTNIESHMIELTFREDVPQVTPLPPIQALIVINQVMYSVEIVKNTAVLFFAVLIPCGTV